MMMMMIGCHQMSFIFKIIVTMIIITTTTTNINKIANREMNILLHQGVLSTGDSPRLMTAKMINHKIEEVMMITFWYLNGQA